MQAAAFAPVQGHDAAAQRQVRGGARFQRRRLPVGAQVALQLSVQPTAVFVQEAVAGDQAGARRQGQARAAFVHAELEPARARIAHALYFHPAPVIQFQFQGVALHALRRAVDQSVQHRSHVQL